MKRMNSTLTVAFRAGLFASVAIMTATPFAAAAQTAPAPAEQPADSGLADIIVTARKTAENQQNVPVAITAFSAATLEAQNATRVTDVARTTPSLTVRDSASSPGGPTFTLRGQVQTDILATLDPSVGAYVDGLYWARAYGLNSDLLDVSSIQVLKGPQGTLFGRNTTGGALLVETADPKLNAFSGMAQATYGRFNEVTGTAVVNVPIGDKAAFRGAFQVNKRDPYTRDIANGRRYDEKNSWTGRAKLLIAPNDSFTAVLSYEHYDLDVANTSRRLYWVQPGSPAATTAGSLATANAYIASIANAPNATAMDTDPRVKNTSNTYLLTLTQDTNFGAIKLTSGYRTVDADTTLDLDGSPYPIHATTGTQSLHQFSSELQVTGKVFEDRLDFAAGALYFDEGGFDKSSSVTIPQANPRTTLFRGDIFNYSLGGYTQAGFHITDRLTLTAGVRYSFDSKGLTINNTTLTRATGVVGCQIPGLIAPNCQLSRKDGFGGWSYIAGIDYKITPDVLIYAKTSRGFRSGGQNLRASGSAAFVPFAPEIAYAHEAGLKSEFFGKRLRFNLAGYYTLVQDIQRTTLTNVAPGITASILSNAGKARFYGVEAEVTAKLFDGFTLGATGTITRPKYLQYADLSGDRRQERFDSVSREQFSLSGDYDHMVGSARLRVHTDYSWQSAQPLNNYNSPADPNNAIIVAGTTGPATGVLSARASLAFNDGAYEVAVFGRNITDDRSVIGALYVPGLSYVSQTIREPATYGVTATIRFGQ
ncbi:TonB-dependent receptor [Sphingomonas immobilis]|uniref:TonB-dependent receptor n=1 Tax=Sphingomonas immobilis TaxID=3063997 RepID=A0ABT8ZXA0_9SPHN|nr:TonB-dependent receptor [Sphingomonas sp. CA1-15]MDO7842200.1 TonB-dependent receptor [Sphingomonas sp. CA1-15]